MENKIFAVRYNGAIDYFLSHRSRRALKRMIKKYLHLSMDQFIALGGGFVKVSAEKAKERKCLL